MSEFIAKLGSLDYQEILNTVAIVISGGLGTITLFLIRALKIAKTKTPEDLSKQILDKAVELIKPTVNKELGKMTDFIIKQQSSIDSLTKNFLLYASKIGIDADTLNSMIANTSNLDKTTKEVLDSEVVRLVEETKKAIEQKEQDKKELEEAVNNIKTTENNPYALK